MGRRPYSDDLRARVVAAVAGGCSRRAAAERFAVSAPSAVRWVALHDETGSVSARRQGGKSRSPLEPHASWPSASDTQENNDDRSAGDMTTPADYRDFAYDCLRWADETDDAGQRDTLIGIACIWTLAATTVEDYVTLARDDLVRSRELRAKLN